MSSSSSRRRGRGRNLGRSSSGGSGGGSSSASGSGSRSRSLLSDRGCSDNWLNTTCRRVVVVVYCPTRVVRTIG